MLSYMRGSEYLEKKNTHGGDRVSSSQNDHLKTVDFVAEEYNTSPKTIQRDAQLTNAINTIAETSPELKNAADHRETKDKLYRSINEIRRTAIA